MVVVVVLVLISAMVSAVEMFRLALKIICVEASGEQKYGSKY